jgi:peptidyl-prolyl cis-trans isomerase C
MSSFRFLSCFLPAACLLAQTPSPAPHPGQQTAPGVKMEVMQPKEGTLPQVPPDTVILRIGDEKITAGEFASFIESLPEQVRGQARGSARKQLAENLIKVKLIAQEARRKQADQDKLFKLQSAYQVDNLLAVYYLNNYLKTAKFSDEELKKYYDEHKKDYDVMRGRHILIRFAGSQVPLKPNQKDLTDAEALAKAQELRKRLQAGADFAQIAKEESDDAGSGANGGSLGEFRHGTMVGPFDEAAGALPLGEISEPVKTPYGYHLIQIQSRSAKTFDEVKDEIDKKMRPQLTEKLIAELRTKSGVTMDESYFNASQPSPPPSTLVPVLPTPK